jgi:hypothetical protein
MKTQYAPIHVLFTCHIYCPFHPPWFVHPHNNGWGIQTWSSLLWNILHSSVTFFLLLVVPNIFSEPYYTKPSYKLNHRLAWIV